MSFTEKWLASLGTWHGRLSVLSRVDLVDKAQAIEKALAELGVAHVARVYDLSSQRARTRGTRRMGGFAIRWGRRTEADGRRRFRFGL